MKEALALLARMPAAGLPRMPPSPCSGKLAALVVGLLLVASTAAAQVPSLPVDLYDYAGVQLPDHYLTNSFAGQFQSAAIEHDSPTPGNPLTNEGATLGRVLFYDKKLSASGTIACASCHQQSLGFDDPNQFSVGHAGGLTRRHSMTLTNARFNFRGRYFWDERAATLEDQALMPFQDPVEMGLTLAELVEIVEGEPYYGSLFAAAFGDPTVTSDRIARAIAQFVRTLVSFDAKYDQGRVQVGSPLAPFPNFTASENAGKTIFFLPGSNGRNCAGCHASEAFLNVIPLGPPPPFITHAINNGLDATSTTDLGVQESSGNANDQGKFRLPSLRNIGVRAPHGHDGRFATLEDVVEFYSTGIQNHPNLTPGLRDGMGGVLHFNFTTQQKADLVAFLHTLTDTGFLTDEKFSDPFVAPLCGASPASSCVAATQGTLLVNEKSPGRERIKANLKKLNANLTKTDLGSPVNGASRYDVCIYDQVDSLVASMTVDRAAQACGTKDCWKDVGTVGYQYKDKTMSASGVQKIRGLANVALKGKLQVTGKNNDRKGQLSLPTGIAAALEANSQATVQVLVDDGLCFEMVLPTVTKADGDIFKAKLP